MELGAAGFIENTPIYQLLSFTICIITKKKSVVMVQNGSFFLFYGSFLVFDDMLGDKTK
jgi:hypothetical protein